MRLGAWTGLYAQLWVLMGLVLFLGDAAVTGPVLWSEMLCGRQPWLCTHLMQLLSSEDHPACEASMTITLQTNLMSCI